MAFNGLKVHIQNKSCYIVSWVKCVLTQLWAISLWYYLLESYLFKKLVDFNVKNHLGEEECNGFGGQAVFIG